MSERLATALCAPLIVHPYSLDLIDVTRSPHHRALFPPMTRKWPEEDREYLLSEVYLPYRDSVRTAISKQLRQFSFLIHLSVSTFEPKYKGKMRRADLGLLYDPANENEVGLCIDWINEMYDEAPMLRVRRNYPRRGTTDSLTRAMRTEFEGKFYLGIELMLNRAWASRQVPLRDQAIDSMAIALRQTITDVRSEAA